MAGSESFQEKSKRLRKERTIEIARELKAGQYIPAAFNASLSWFPPRPLIKKDGVKVSELHEVPLDD